MKLALVKGSTSQRLYLFVQNSSVTTGAGLTGLVFNSAGLTAYYVRPGGSATAITLVTQTATGAYSSGGFVEVDATNMPGVYRFDVPNAVLASGVDSAVVLLKGATNMAPVPLEIQLTDFNLNSTTNAVGAAASVTGAVGSVTGNVGGNVAGSVGSVTAAVTVGINNDKTGYGLSLAAVQAIWDALTSALTTAGSVGKLIVDNLNATISSRLASASYTAQSGDSYARLGAPAGASVSADVAALRSRLSTTVTRTGAVATDAGNSATAFKTDLTESANDHFKDCLLKITSGALAEQVKKVTAYNGTTKVITVQGGFTGTPADAVTFELVND